ncbi:hypothetical protein AAG570_002739 [Ranatra chinensis]|uniref:Uncharacterized protein n=1 Tax=Ranatra chinensis TaxID=642074 RepID=A0ABD0Y8H7_9HEMI
MASKRRNIRSKRRKKVLIVFYRRKLETCQREEDRLTEVKALSTPEDLILPDVRMPKEQEERRQGERENAKEGERWSGGRAEKSEIHRNRKREGKERERRSRGRGEKSEIDRNRKREGKEREREMEQREMGGSGAVGEGGGGRRYPAGCSNVTGSGCPRYTQAHRGAATRGKHARAPDVEVRSGNVGPLAAEVAHYRHHHGAAARPPHHLT